jgi:hypothetical protein
MEPVADIAGFLNGSGGKFLQSSFKFSALAGFGIDGAEQRDYFIYHVDISG